jgi:hypothetical protein
MGFIWRRPLVQVVEEGIPVWTAGLAHELTFELREEAEAAKHIMKAMAAWTDRTGAARAGLDSFVVNGYPDHIAWYFTHGVDIHYAMFLETMQAGSYGIVVSTAEMFYQQMMFHLAQMGVTVL